MLGEGLSGFASTGSVEDGFLCVFQLDSML